MAMLIKGHANKAFEVLGGGYAQEFNPHRGWVQVSGAEVKLTHQTHAAPGSRRERRVRMSEGDCQCSAVTHRGGA
jgi:hypothetical protein